MFCRRKSGYVDSANYYFLEFPQTNVNLPRYLLYKFHGLLIAAFDFLSVCFVRFTTLLYADVVVIF